MLGMNFRSFLTLLVVERGCRHGKSLDFALPLPGRNQSLPREGCGGLGRRLAGFAGTGTLVVEDPKRLPGTGDSGRDRLYSPERAVLEGVCKALRRWIRCRRGNPTEAGSIEQPRVLQKGSEQMQRQPSCCDFCGLPEISQKYPTDTEGISWYACLECARLVDTEGWDRLIQRGVVACAQIRPISEDEMRVLRRQMEQLVENFRVVRLAIV